MILDIPATIDKVLRPVLFKLGKDLLVGLSDCVVEHIESSAMRHAHHNFFTTKIGRCLDQVIQKRDQRFAAL